MFFTRSERLPLVVLLGLPTRLGWLLNSAVLFHVVYMSVLA